MKHARDEERDEIKDKLPPIKKDNDKILRTDRANNEKNSDRTSLDVRETQENVKKEIEAKRKEGLLASIFREEFNDQKPLTSLFLPLNSILAFVVSFLRGGLRSKPLDSAHNVILGHNRIHFLHIVVHAIQDPQSEGKQLIHSDWMLLHSSSRFIADFLDY